MLVGATGTDLPTTVEGLLGPELLGRLDRVDIVSRKVFPGKLPGERQSKKRGQGVEFDDYRPYVAGDDLRRIDWNVFARHDKFVMKLFKEDEDLGVHLFLDATASMDAGDPSKRLLAHRLAMALGYIGLTRQNRVSITTLRNSPDGAEVVRLAPMRGRPNVSRLADFVLASLAGTLDAPATPIADSSASASGDTLGSALSTFARGLGVGGVVIVLSDFLEPAWLDPAVRNHALNTLIAQGSTDPTLIQILTPGELDPKVESEYGLVGDLRLTDVETAKAAEVTVSAALIKSYKRRLDAHLAGLSSAAAARDIGHVLVPSDAEAADFVFQALRSRSILV